ncbi:MAG: MG2 domain-containing protein, partial [Acidobacteriota bacterium]|nr:MG2 domain-containing protein [Acidobacteriota bacterium]
RTTIKPKKETGKKAANADEGDEEGGDAEGGDAETKPSYVVMANEGGNFAISDLESYYFEQGGGGDEEGGDSSNFHGYIYTDRPVYRTNQKVYFKGILRKRTEKGYALPSGPVTVTVEDTNNAQIFQQQMTLSSRGTFSGEVNIDEDAPLGTYTVVAESNDGTARGSFEVMEYKKPEYKVTVTTPQKFIPTGTTARFTVSARYFFGSPVTKADVKYYVYRSRYYPTFFQEPTDPLADFGVEDSNSSEGGDYGEGGDSMVEEGDGKLDSNGQLNVDFKVPEATAKQSWDYTYRLEAQVTDAARREMSASGEFTGIRGTTVADAETEQYVYFQGDTAKILVHTRDYDGKPKPANVTLKFVENTWEKIEKNDYGYTYYDYKLHENELSSANVQTNDQGEASLDYRVDHPGAIQIRAVVNENGKQIASNGGSIWVADRNGAWTDYSYQGENQIKLVPDKKSYKVGETAHVLALLPKEQGHLLVTTELMSVMSVREIDTAGRAAVIDVPIDAKFAPNIFLNVTYVRNGEMYTAEESIVVPPRDKLLKLDIIPNKSEYKPRETVSYTVVAHNGDGTPAANAEVSLGVVDEAIYSVSPDNAEDIRRDFYGRRANEVNTTYSTNYSFTGYAGKKPIKLAENKRAYQLADFKNDANLVEPVVRKLFKDTAYWAPAVTTGRDGKATVNVQLPDNLTTWRATARAVTADTRVGVTTSKVVERKDVIIRLATPRFLTAGDTVTISGIAHNYLKDDKQTQISLSVNGAQLL